MTEQMKKTAEETAKDLLQGIKVGKKVHEIFSKNFVEEYQISGKTIKEWENKFKISVPSDPDPGVCKSLDMKIMGLYQEAAFFHAIALAQCQMLRKGSESEYRSRYAAIIAEWKQENPGKRTPAAGTLDTLTRAETDDIEGAVANAELQKDFWKHIMDHLNMCRRLLENATINSGIQIKMDGNHRGNIYE